VSESFSVELNLRRQLNQEWSLSGGIGYLMDDLEGFGVATREDEEGFGYLGLNYRIVRWGNIGAELRYSDRTSTAAEFEYDRLQAGLRFSARW
jgi:hypothetical protein